MIVADRNTPGAAVVFERSPDLVAFVRVRGGHPQHRRAAASAQGVLVTRASAGFVPAVTELVFGFLVDLSRGVSRAVAEYHAGARAGGAMGRQLAGSTLGVIGYGAIGRRVAAMGAALGMRVLVSDPHARVAEPGIEQVAFGDAARASDYVVCLADRQRANGEPDERCGIRAHEAGRLLRERLARQPRRRSGARARARLGPHRAARRWTSAARPTRCPRPRSRGAPT